MSRERKILRPASARFEVTCWQQQLDCEWCAKHQKCEAAAQRVLIHLTMCSCTARRRPVAPPKNFVVPRKICFKHIIKTNIAPKMVFCHPETLKPGYGPGLSHFFSVGLLWTKYSDLRQQGKGKYCRMYRVTPKNRARENLFKSCEDPLNFKHFALWCIKKVSNFSPGTIIPQSFDHWSHAA